MSYDYRNDRYGSACLKEAVKSKSEIGFGALLVKNGRIIGRGWNRRSTSRERKILSHVDYAIHAEQACVVEALDENSELNNCEIFVLGLVLLGPKKGTLTTRERKIFICKKCPASIFIPYNISVNVPYIGGWAKLNPAEASKTANEYCGNGYWRNFTGVRNRKNARSGLKNIFVPLIIKGFNDFSKGKVFEIRRAERGWNRNQIYTGRGITLSCGYSGPRLYGKIGEIAFGNLETIFKRVPFRKIEPSAKTRIEANKINLELLGQAKEYVAFEIILNGN